MDNVICYLPLELKEKEQPERWIHSGARRDEKKP